MIVESFTWNLKRSSRAILRNWQLQFSSIITQRTQRLQQLFGFYRYFYGTYGLKQIWNAYQRKVRKQLRDNILYCALGICTAGAVSGKVNWKKERLSTLNFGLCAKDIEFVKTLSTNTLCDNCKRKDMKYCYCKIGNKKCKSGGEFSIKNCRKNFVVNANVEDGNAVIKAADEKNWEPYLHKNEFSIWKREETTARYAYKVHASFKDITAMDLLYVQTNLNYRKEWDDTAVHLDVIENDPVELSNSHLIYWEMKWPKLFANRDYVYSRRFIIDKQHNIILICSRATNHADYPEFQNKVRVKNYWSYMVIIPFRKLNEPGVHFVLTYYDDPGVPVPEKIKSWVTEKQMPEFLKSMYVATKIYASSSVSKKQIKNIHEFKISNYPYTMTLSKYNSLWRQTKPKRDSDELRK